MILDKFGLANKIAIVTGCSTGLGQGMALALAEAGADIVGVNRSEAPEIQKSIEALGRKYLAIKADLTSTKPIDQIISTAINAFGKIDILINNAGIIRRCEALEFSEPDWDEVMNLNLKTTFFLAQAVARQFIK